MAETEPPIPPHLEAYAPQLSDEELVNLPTRALNRFFHVNNIPKDVQTYFKLKRRCIKNRYYARACRHRRLNRSTELQEKTTVLQKEVMQVRLEKKLCQLIIAYLANQLINASKDIALCNSKCSENHREHLKKISDEEDGEFDDKIKQLTDYLE